MNSKSFEVLDIMGNLISHYEVESLTSLSRLVDGYLLCVSQDFFVDISTIPSSEIHVPEEGRIIMVQSEEDKNLLLTLEPFRCYMRMPDMTSTVMMINPYHSVRWLKKYIKGKKNISTDIRLIVNSE